jgi:hypothetical protein
VFLRVNASYLALDKPRSDCEGLSSTGDEFTDRFLKAFEIILLRAGIKPPSLNVHNQP